MSAKTPPQIEFISPTELARRIGVTKQAVHKALNEGLLPFQPRGKKKLIDLADPGVKAYIEGETRQREHAKKKDVSAPHQKKRSEKPAVKQQKPGKRSEKPDEKKQSLYIRGMEGGRFFTGKLRTAILERDNHRCVLCGKTPTDGVRLEVDHIKEFEDGGKTVYDNGQTVCSECNKGKASAKDITGDEYISITEFGKRVGVHRNGIAEAIKQGRIKADSVTGKINYTTEILKWFNKHDSNIINLNSQIDSLTIHELQHRKKVEEVKKLQIQNAQLRGTLLQREMINDYLFLYLDKVHSNLERLAGAFLTDTGHKIIDKNGVTSEVREEWKSGILQSIDNAKKEIIKRLQNIEKRQNE